MSLFFKKLKKHKKSLKQKLIDFFNNDEDKLSEYYIIKKYNLSKFRELYNTEILLDKFYLKINGTGKNITEVDGCLQVSNILLDKKQISNLKNGLEIKLEEDSTWYPNISYMIKIELKIPKNNKFIKKMNSLYFNQNINYLNLNGKTENYKIFLLPIISYINSYEEDDCNCITYTILCSPEGKLYKYIKN